MRHRIRRNYQKPELSAQPTRNYESEYQQRRQRVRNAITKVLAANDSAKLQQIAEVYFEFPVLEWAKDILFEQWQALASATNNNSKGEDKHD